MRPVEPKGSELNVFVPAIRMVGVEQVADNLAEGGGIHRPRSDGSRSAISARRDPISAGEEFCNHRSSCASPTGPGWYRRYSLKLQAAVDQATLSASCEQAGFRARLPSIERSQAALRYLAEPSSIANGAPSW